METGYSDGYMYDLIFKFGFGVEIGVGVRFAIGFGVKFAIGFGVKFAVGFGVGRCRISSGVGLARLLKCGGFRIRFGLWNLALKFKFGVGICIHFALGFVELGCSFKLGAGSTFQG
eukprot:787681-Amorphochlora_amoeboformis.AAC.1